MSDPIKIKKVEIRGITENQRQTELLRLRKKYEDRGWTFISYIDPKGLKGSIDGGVAEFHRLVPPNSTQSLQDSLDDNSGAIWGVVTIIVLVLMIKSCAENANEQQMKRTAENQQLEQQHKIDLDKRIATANEIAKSLTNFLRNNGVDKSLISEINVNEFGRLRIVVTNAWLSYPAYEQKQMKQTIDLALKKIYSPDGWDFKIVDYMGNSI